MSDSRLEKFIYAICSMDVSDLPVPLSRIEKLWNCLITGETPDFEPLSRNEKYLMAMLDRYDISNLPAPMSRGEKLLYKIAVGETDLSDVPGYLSRYEELLKYLIENGGIGFEYVLYTINQSLYTLYTTAEKPVKSAILKGQTLVNIFDNSLLYGFNYCTINSDGSLTMNAIGRYTECNFKLSSYIGKKVTIFIIFDENTIDVESYNLQFPIFGHNNFTRKEDRYLKKYVGVVEDDYLRFGLKPDVTSGSIKFKFMVIEGDFLNQDIPYFTGMQSVKMPVLMTVGKNLFDKEAFYNDWKSKKDTYVYKEIVDNEEVLKVNNFHHLFYDKDGFRINVKKGVPLTLRMECKKAGTHTTNSVFVIRYDDKKYLDFSSCRSDEWVASTITFVPTRDYITFCSGYNYDDYFYVKNIQLEEGSTATTYEPFKSNILTVNEPIELRGIGEVQDTLDLMTGEYVQRIGEVKITDEMIDKFTLYDSFISNFDSIFSGLPERKIETFGTTSPMPMVSDKMIAVAWRGAMEENAVYFSQYKSGLMRAYHSPTWTIEEFKEWFRENKPTIQYKLATPVIKTVVLTVVDQDNQPTKLGTFENVTYVSLESAGLIPEVKMEVATRISKELASASPLMDDISNNQQRLESTVDEQSNNVDATMIATTEIYEGTL